MFYLTIIVITFVLVSSYYKDAIQPRHFVTALNEKLPTS